MPPRRTKTKSPGGYSGLVTETTSEGQTPDQTMNSDESSVAAVELPHQETPAEQGDAAIKALDDLFDTSNELPALDPLPLHSEDLTVDVDNEEEDVFLLPESQNFVPGTAEDFTEKLRFNGLRWRHEVRKRVKKDPNLRDFLL